MSSPIKEKDVRSQIGGPSPIESKGVKMKRYISDSITGICLDGIRNVQRVDGYSSGFNLQVSYKNNHFNILYKTSEERDKTFNMIIEELNLRNK